MTHTHSPKDSREILGNTLYTCSCGARKWSNDSEIENGIEDLGGWYTPKPPEEAPEETARIHAVEMLQTEGHGYDCNQPASYDPLDSHHPDFQD